MTALKTNFAKLFAEAEAAGVAAATARTPMPMMVTEHANPLNDESEIKRAWYVPDGVCGFAWVVVRPGTSAFARWLVKTGKGRKAYGGGIQIWISGYNQSMEKKEAHAAAMAAVLSAAGITAYADSRMD